MQSQYQSLLGTYEPIDILETNSLLVHKDALIEGGINVAGNAYLADLTLPTGARLGRVLTSDALGHATWEELTKQLIGDASGPFGATVVNTLAAGTIPVSSIVLLDAIQTVRNKSIVAATNLEVLGLLLRIQAFPASCSSMVGFPTSLVLAVTMLACARARDCPLS